MKMCKHSVTLINKKAMMQYRKTFAKSASKRKIKVMHIIPNFGEGGGEGMAVELIKATDKSIFDVAAVSLFAECGSVLEEKLSEINVKVWYLGKTIGLDIKIFFKLFQVIKQFAPDIVHTHRYALYYTFPVLSMCMVPVKVHTVHTTAEREVGLRRFLYWLAYKSGIVPVAIAREVQMGLQRVYKIYNSPLIPNGIPVVDYISPSLGRSEWRAKEGFEENDILFTCVARLSSEKEHRVVVEAFRESSSLNHHAKLILVGSGPLKEEIIEQIQQLGLQKQVYLLGFRDDISNLLNACDVFVLSSSREGSPLVIMEAMASSKPIVATDVGGVSELVKDGFNGYVVPSGDIVAFSSKMVEFVNNVEKRIKFGLRAAQFAKATFDVHKMAAAYEKLYLSSIDGK